MKYLFLFVFFLYCNSANAFTVSEYQELKKNSKDLEILKTYFEGVGSGIFWSNVFIHQKLKEKLWCPPQNIKLNSDHYISIIDGELKSRFRFEDEDIEPILLEGLVNAFPCKGETKISE